MPTRLCCNPSMMCLPRTGRVGSWRLQDDVEVYSFPAAVPTLMGVAAVLMSVQGAEGMKYIPLAPLSTMTVSVLGGLILPVLRSRGWGIQRK